jgi:hypothetical protein
VVGYLRTRANENGAAQAVPGSEQEQTWVTGENSAVVCIGSEPGVTAADTLDSTGVNGLDTLERSL